MNHTPSLKLKLSTTFFALNLFIVTSVVVFWSPDTSTAAALPITPTEESPIVVTISKGDTLITSPVGSESFAVTPITGLEPGEKITMVDSLPGGDKFLALSDKGNIHIIDGSGKSIKKVPFAFLNSLDLSDIDYDPTTDKVIFIEKNGHRVVIDEKTGSIDSLRPLAYGNLDPNKDKMPSITGLAHNNTTVGSASSTAYVLDSAQNVLSMVNIDTGALQTVGNLGVNVSKSSGFDIQPLTNEAYALLTPLGQTNPDLYQINLKTGGATRMFTYGEEVKGFAIAPPPLKNFHCLISPPTATNRIGTEHTVNVFAFDGITLISTGGLVQFKVIDGPNKGMQQAFGGASFTYGSNGSPGVDKIEARVEIGTDVATCTARKEWVKTPYIAKANIDGKKLTVEGFVDANAANSILVNGKEQATKTTSETELFSKKGGKKVKDGAEITIIGGGNQSNVFTFGQTVPDLDCVLSPLITTNKPGETNPVDLLIFARGQEVFDQSNVKDLSVKVLMGPNEGKALNPLAGNKSFTYTSQKEGVDVIEVKGTFEGRSFSCRAFRRWIQNP